MNSLPDILLMDIFLMTSWNSVIKFAFVCKKWSEIAQKCFNEVFTSHAHSVDQLPRRKDRQTIRILSLPQLPLSNKTIGTTPSFLLSNITFTSNPFRKLPGDLGDVAFELVKFQQHESDYGNYVMMDLDLLVALKKWKMCQAAFESLLNSTSWLQREGIFLFPNIDTMISGNGKHLHFYDLRMGILGDARLKRVEFGSCFGNAMTDPDQPAIVVNAHGQMLKLNDSLPFPEDVWSGIYVTFCCLVKLTGISCVSVRTSDHLLRHAHKIIIKMDKMVPFSTLAIFTEEVPEQVPDIPTSIDIGYGRGNQPQLMHLAKSWPHTIHPYPIQSLSLRNSLKSNEVTSNLILISVLLGQGLQNLDLSKNGISTKNMDPLVIALNKNPRLKKLNLSHNKIDSRGSNLLATSLLTNSNLEILVLKNNLISEVQVWKRTLVSPLTALRRLDFFDNPLGSRHALHLLPALVSNRALECLNLATTLSWENLGLEKGIFSWLHDDLQAHVLPYLRMNRTLKELIVRADGLFSTLSEADLISMERFLNQQHGVESLVIISDELLESAGLGSKAPDAYEASKLEDDARQEHKVAPWRGRKRTDSSGTTFSKRVLRGSPSPIAFSERTTESESITENGMSEELEDTMRDVDLTPVTFLSNIERRESFNALRVKEIVCKILRQPGPGAGKGKGGKKITDYLLRNKPGLFQLVALNDLKRWKYQDETDWDYEQESVGLMDGTIAPFHSASVDLIPKWGQLAPVLFDAEEWLMQEWRRAFVFCSRWYANGGSGLAATVWI